MSIVSSQASGVLDQMQRSSIDCGDPEVNDKLDQYLHSTDIYTDPDYQDTRQARGFMSLRVDTRGEPIRRTLIGDKKMY